jgi:hypothetical protein
MEQSFSVVSRIMNIPPHLLERYGKMYALTADFCGKYRATFKSSTEWWTFVSKLFIGVFGARLEREQMPSRPGREADRQDTSNQPTQSVYETSRGPDMVAPNPIALGNIMSFITHDIIVDSRVRDRTKYPNANLFTLPIDLVRNVIIIELVSAIVPQTQYNITTSRRWVWRRIR